jgi:hypothetical protein
MYKLYCNGTEITDFISNLTTTDNIDSLSVEMNFSIVKNPKDKYLTASAPIINCGDKILFKNDNTEIFRGIVLSAGFDGSIKANDYGFYLNKSEMILQCNKVSAANAIKMMCNKMSIPIGSIASMPTIINKNYISMTPADILKDIIDQTTAEQGKNYLYKIEQGKLNIYTYPTKPITALYKQVSGNSFDVTWLLGEVSGSKSIEELKNSVKVIKNDNEVVKNLANAQDSTSISKYGLLQHIETLDSESTQNSNMIAKNKLKELDVVTEDYSVGNMLGSDAVKSGVMLEFSSTAYGIAGYFIVTEVTHNYGATHTMALTIKRVKSV